MPPFAEKGGSSARTSPARSSSRGQEEHRRVESAPMAPLALEAPYLAQLTRSQLLRNPRSPKPW